MKRTYYNITNENLPINQILSSLVINPPYAIDGLTTSPKISKILSFPLGIKVDSGLLFKSTFFLVLNTLIFMALSCLLIICFYLPIQNQNAHLFNNAKSLANQKLINLTKIQEVTNYNNLFSNANLYSLTDPEEIIRINRTEQPQIIAQTKTFNKYPSIQFSGY